MVMAVNNVALLTQPTDISNLSASYRDGQKLRQEYDARQHQKALNDLMKISGADEIETAAQQLAAAQKHRYAGALVPAIQDYHDKLRKARLENLDKSASIDKTQAETGKLGAETGKITTEAEDTRLKIAQGIKDYISAAAVTQNPKVFGLQIGELKKRGLITDSQTEGLLKLVVSSPENAAQVMQQMAMGSLEVAKVFVPEFKTLDGGDKIYGFNVNKFTGEPSNPNMTINKAATPDAVLRGEVDTQNNIRSTQASMYASDNSLKGTMYSSDNSLQGTMYTADSNAATRTMEINQDGQIDWFNAETARIRATNSGTGAAGGAGSAGGAGGAGQPRKMSDKAIELDNKYQQQLTTNAATLKEIANWTKKISSGKLKLGVWQNAANSAGNFLGTQSIGQNPKDYAEFNAFLKDLANKGLRLNAGVQTDADYKRQLEGMVAGTYIPRDNATAKALLARMSKDFATANKGIHNSRVKLNSEYGRQLPAYGAGAKKTAQPAKQTAKPANTGNKGNNAKVKTIENKWFN